MLVSLVLVSPLLASCRGEFHMSLRLGPMLLERLALAPLLFCSIAIPNVCALRIANEDNAGPSPVHSMIAAGKWSTTKSSDRRRYRRREVDLDEHDDNDDDADRNGHGLLNGVLRHGGLQASEEETEHEEEVNRQESIANALASASQGSRRLSSSKDGRSGAEPSTGPSGNATHKKKHRVLGGYGQRTVKALSRWYEVSKPWGKGPFVNKVVFCCVASIFFVGPFAFYGLIYTVIIKTFTRETKGMFPWLGPASEALALPIGFLSVFICWDIVIRQLSSGTTRAYPLLDDIDGLLKFGIKACLFVMPISLLQKADHALHAKTVQWVTSESYLQRRDFINSVAFGARVVGPTQGNEDLRYFLFAYLWRPFYMLTVAFIVLGILIEASGNYTQGYVLIVCYLIITTAMGVFGARTLGRELYGGLVLFLEKPFVEGDIITLDKSSSRGGAQTDIAGSAVTGFVERIGLRSTVVRRFDMRAVWVPNSLFVEHAVANWNTRPRKLIYIQYAVSHRTPVELCKTFQEQVNKLVQNHAGVDQNMYTKVALRKLDAGLNFLVVCFTAHGAKKQVVQQEIILTIVALSRKLGISLTFNQQNSYVEREEVPQGELYLQADAQSLVVDFDDLLPAKRPQAKDDKRYSPAGSLVIRVEKVIFTRDEQIQALQTGKAFRVKMMTAAHRQDTSILTTGTSSALGRRTTMRGDDTPMEVWTRTQLKIAGGPTETSREMRFFENLHFDLEDCVLPDVLEVYIFQVSKSFRSLSAGPIESLGSARCDVRETARANSACKATQLALCGEDGQAVGFVTIRVFIPESEVLKAERALLPGAQKDAESGTGNVDSN